jgi:hypothetical protein
MWHVSFPLGAAGSGMGWRSRLWSLLRLSSGGSTCAMRHGSHPRLDRRRRRRRATTPPAIRWRRCPSTAGTGSATSSGSVSVSRGATTSTWSSVTTDATRATTSCAATWPICRCGPVPASRKAACCTTRTPGRPSTSFAAPTPRRRCRSTMWWRWPTPGTRVPGCGTTSAAATSPTTRAICAFVARQVEVKTDYQLWVSGKEKDAMREVLRDC